MPSPNIKGSTASPCASYECGVQQDAKRSATEADLSQGDLSIGSRWPGKDIKKMKLQSPQGSAGLPVSRIALVGEYMEGPVTHSLNLAKCSVTPDVKSRLSSMIEDAKTLLEASDTVNNDGHHDRRMSDFLESVRSTVDGLCQNVDTHATESLVIPAAISSLNQTQLMIQNLVYESLRTQLGYIDSESRSKVHAAIAEDRVELLRTYIGSGCSKNYRDDLGNTLVMQAAFSNATQCIDYLLEQGACPNQPNDDGLTPLKVAVREGNIDAVKKLEPITADKGKVVKYACEYDQLDCYLHFTKNHTGLNNPIAPFLYLDTLDDDTVGVFEYNLRVEMSKVIASTSVGSPSSILKFLSDACALVQFFEPTRLEDLTDKSFLFVKSSLLSELLAASRYDCAVQYLTAISPEGEVDSHVGIVNRIWLKVTDEVRSGFLQALWQHDRDVFRSLVLTSVDADTPSLLSTSVKEPLSAANIILHKIEEVQLSEEEINKLSPTLAIAVKGRPVPRSGITNIFSLKSDLDVYTIQQLLLNGASPIDLNESIFTFDPHTPEQAKPLTLMVATIVSCLIKGREIVREDEVISSIRSLLEQSFPVSRLSLQCPKTLSDYAIRLGKSYGLSTLTKKRDFFMAGASKSDGLNRELHKAVLELSPIIKASYSSRDVANARNCTLETMVNHLKRISTLKTLPPGDVMPGTETKPLFGDLNVSRNVDITPITDKLASEFCKRRSTLTKEHFASVFKKLRRETNSGFVQHVMGLVLDAANQLFSAHRDDRANLIKMLVLQPVDDKSKQVPLDHIGSFLTEVEDYGDYRLNIMPEDGYRLHWATSDTDLPEPSRHSVMIIRQADESYRVRVFDQSSRSTNYQGRKLSSEVIDSITAQRDHSSRLTDQEFVANLTLNLNHTSDGLPKIGDQSVVIKKQADKSYLVRIFDQRNSYQDYPVHSPKVLASISAKVNGTSELSEEAFIRNLAPTLGHNLYSLDRLLQLHSINVFL